MRRLLHTGVFFLVCFAGVAQVPYTNVVNHVAHNTRPALEVVGDYYYVANNLNDSSWTLDYVKLDTNGTVVKKFSYVVDSAQFPSNCPKCLDYHNGVLYHAYSDGIASIPGTDTGAIVLCKINPDLSDTIMTQHYIPVHGGGCDIKALEFDSDSTFIIAATNFFYTGDSAPQAVFKYATLVARLDTSFNILWETIIPDTDSTRNFGVFPEDIVIDKYGSILVTGTPAWVAQVSEAFAARLRVSDGHLYWRKSYTGNLGIRGMNALDHGDGTYRYVQNWYTDVQDGFFELHIGILDTTGTILDEQVYAKPERRHLTDDLIRLKDGNYYCAGVTFWGGYKGLGFKFSPQLDSLWMRQYQYGPTSNTCNVDIFKEDSSGMIVHTGWVTSNQLDNWIFRIDTYGCDTSDCGLGIDENYALDSRWRVFPNPSTGSFTVDHPEIDRLGQLHIQVIDMQGRITQESQLLGSSIKMFIDTPGLYYIRISDQYQTFGVQPITIQY